MPLAMLQQMSCPPPLVSLRRYAVVLIVLVAREEANGQCAKCDLRRSRVPRVWYRLGEGKGGVDSRLRKTVRDMNIA